MITKVNNKKIKHAQLATINNIVSEYLLSLSVEQVNSEEVVPNILIIADAYKILEDKKKGLELAYSLFKKLQTYIHDGKFTTIGLFGGLADIAYAARSLYIATSEFNQLSTSLATKIINKIQDICTYCINNMENVANSHYDVINGLSGVGYYLANLHGIESEKALYEIARYLHLIAQSHKDTNGKWIPNWHVKGINQINYNREEYPEGHINFGLSHGIAGPLMVLSKAYELQHSEIIKESIENILIFYMKYSITDKFGILRWPALLQLDDFRKSKINLDNTSGKSSWCYGNLSISRAIQLSANRIGNYEVEYKAIKNIELICNNRELFLEFNQPIICHGYSGPLLQINAIARENENIIYNETIEYLIDNILKYYIGKENGHFSQVGPQKGMLEGVPGVIISLLAILNGESFLENQLFIN